MKMKKQSIGNQKGEIEFRRKLVKQQVSGKNIFSDEFDSGGIKKILKERMDRTFKQIGLLQKKLVDLSPYIEIGAERCQRSLVMENDIGANGAALDISYEMLKTCDYYKKIFKKKKIPVRICCDANNLPFMSDSVPFVFCYQTLHHFPDPCPVIREIYRVISPGGGFYFDEEPYKKILHLNLYKGSKIYSKNSVNAAMIRRMLDYFFSEKTCNETEHGVMENEDISLKTWKKSLALFKDKEVNLKSMRYIKSRLYGLRNPLTFLMAYLFGGSISGLVKKKGGKRHIVKNIESCLICPECLDRYENGSDRKESKLHKEEKYFECENCHREYPIINGVIFLFTYEKLEELYPKYYNKNSPLGATENCDFQSRKPSVFVIPNLKVGVLHSPP